MVLSDPAPSDLCGFKDGNNQVSLISFIVYVYYCLGHILTVLKNYILCENKKSLNLIFLFQTIEKDDLLEQTILKLQTSEQEKEGELIFCEILIDKYSGRTVTN